MFDNNDNYKFSHINLNTLPYFIILLFVMLCLPVQAKIATIESLASPYRGASMVYVINPDNIIKPEDSQAINSQLAQLEQQTTIETVVVAVNSIGNIDTREFANKLFNHWKIGKAAKDNGLLILLVVDQREVVFETGYGLEGELPDVTCYRIQQEYMVPLLRDNQYSEGMVSGAFAIYDYFTDSEMQSYLFAKNEAEQSASWTINWSFFIYTTLIALAIVIILPRLIPYKKPENLLKRTQVIGVIVGFLIFIILPSFIAFIILYRFYHNRLKDKATPCPNCHQYGFKVLSKKASLASLTQQELFETQLKSVKYRVCQCKHCQHIFKSETLNKKYIRCTSCQYYAAKKSKSEVIRRATYDATGITRNTYTCLHCGKIITKKITLPKLTYSSSSSGSGSSGSSSSGGSCGGGSSGGGGSRSSF